MINKLSLHQKYNGLIQVTIEKIQQEVDHLFQKSKNQNTKIKRNEHNIEVNRQNIDRINKMLSLSPSIPVFNDDFEENIGE